MLRSNSEGDVGCIYYNIIYYNRGMSCCREILQHSTRVQKHIFLLESHSSTQNEKSDMHGGTGFHEHIAKKDVARGARICASKEGARVVLLGSRRSSVFRNVVTGLCPPHDFTAYSVTAVKSCWPYIISVSDSTGYKTK